MATAQAGSGSAAFSCAKSATRGYKQHKTRDQIDKAQALAQRTEDRLDAYRDKKYDLTAKREILAHDVELDSLFNVLKVGLTLLITYVLRKMLDNAGIVPATFLDRIANLPAWQRVTDTHEFLTFKWNSRDPKTMALLAAQCDTINAMQLRTRGGGFLHIASKTPRAQTTTTIPADQIQRSVSPFSAELLV